MKKSALAVLQFAWAATVVLAMAAMFGVDLPAPLSVLSQSALALVKIILTPVVFIPLFIAMWWLVCTTFARQSGWADLATDYAVSKTGNDVRGVRLTTISGTIGDVPFSRALRAGASEAGMVLTARLPFRPGHPTLLLPWSVVRLSEAEAPVPSGLFSRLFRTEHVTLRVTTHPGFEMHILRSDFERTGIGASAARRQGT